MTVNTEDTERAEELAAVQELRGGEAPGVPDAPKEETVEETADVEAPAEETAEEPKTEEPKVEKSDDVLALLKEALSVRDELERVKGELAEMTKRAKEAEAGRIEAAKGEALRKAGLPEELRRFLSDDVDAWKEEIETLSLTSKASKARGIPDDGVPEDLGPHADDGSSSETVKRFLFG